MTYETKNITFHVIHVKGRRDSRCLKSCSKNDHNKDIVSNCNNKKLEIVSARCEKCFSKW